MKIRKVFLIVLLFSFVFILSSCQKEVLVEKISVYNELVEYEEEYVVQFKYNVFPTNANVIDISWSVNSDNATINENGLFKTKVKEENFIITCLEKNSNINVEFKLNINRDYGHYALWIEDRNFNIINNLNDDLLKEICDKYNNCLIYSNDVIDIIKETEKENTEFIDIISKLKKTYFSEENLKNNMYVLCKISSDGFGQLPMLDVENISFDESLLVSFRQTKEDNTHEELYYLLEIKKDLMPNLFEQYIDNKNIFYVSYEIKFLDEYFESGELPL